MHMKQEISQIYLFIRSHNTNYLNKVSLTLACLFIKTYLMKLSVNVYNEIQENTY